MLFGLTSQCFTGDTLVSTETGLIPIEEIHTYYVSRHEVLVHNGCGETSVDVDLKYKEGWTPAQQAEADANVKALTEAYTVKTPSSRSGTSAASRYKLAYGKILCHKDMMLTILLTCN